MSNKKHLKNKLSKAAFKKSWWRIYLASRSERRKELLKKARIPFRIAPSNFKERTFPGGPARTVVVNAVGKVKCAEVRAKRGIVLGADTIVYFKKQILGKPRDKKEALKMLLSLSGSEHSVYTGIALFDLASKIWKKAYVKSKVKMRKYSADDVCYYISKVNPLDKAGAYAIQDYGDKLVEKIKGSYTNVVGLPMEKLKSLLNHFI